MEILADKLRPNTIDEVIGQTHLIGKNKIITNLINNKKIFSMIFYGRPGTGKTTLAHVIATQMDKKSIFLNATLNNKSDFDKVAMLHSEKSGITMEIFTDMPGMQIDIGNNIKSEKGKQGIVYGKNQGICFQTQYFPNVLNKQEFEIAKVDADKRFCSVTVFKFTAQ